jgi:hypothetical protein
MPPDPESLPEQPVVEAPVVETPAPETTAPETPVTPEAPTVKTDAEQTEEMLTAISEKVAVQGMPAPKEKPAKTFPGTPKDPEEQPKPKADAKPADPKPEPKPERKKPEDYELKPGENLGPGANARVREVVAKWKEAEQDRSRLTQENQALASARNDIQAVLTETKTTPEVLGQLLEFNRLVQTGGYEQALQILDHQRAALAKLAGKDLPGVDLLDDFPDLKAAVDNQQATREVAIHAANLRRQNLLNQQSEQQRQQAHDSQQRDVQVRTQAAQSVEQWEASKSQSDPLYQQKITALTQQGQDGLSRIDRITRSYPPNLWKLRIEEAYDDLQVAAPPPPPPTDIPVPGLTPLRPSGAKGGNVKPQSMEEAVLQRLGIT